MFKMIFTMKPQAGLSFDSFVNYYETKHIPLFASVLPKDLPRPKSFQHNDIKRDERNFVDLRMIRFYCPDGLLP